MPWWGSLKAKQFQIEYTPKSSSLLSFPLFKISLTWGVICVYIYNIYTYIIYTHSILDTTPRSRKWCPLWDHFPRGFPHFFWSSGARVNPGKSSWNTMKIIHPHESPKQHHQKINHHFFHWYPSNVNRWSFHGDFQPFWPRIDPQNAIFRALRPGFRNSLSKVNIHIMGEAAAGYPYDI